VTHVKIPPPTKNRKNMKKDKKETLSPTAKERKPKLKMRW
jgi:hypothetical protein